MFAGIWIDATSGFGRALLYTVVFGVLGVLLQAVELAGAAMIVASIWPRVRAGIRP